MRSAERRQVSRLLSSMQAFPVTEWVAWRAAEFMREHRRANQEIGLGDYLIAATADVEGLDLATLHVGHFPMIRDPRPRSESPSPSRPACCSSGDPAAGRTRARCGYAARRLPSARPAP